MTFVIIIIHKFDVSQLAVCGHASKSVGLVPPLQ